MISDEDLFSRFVAGDFSPEEYRSLSHRIRANKRLRILFKRLALFMKGTNRMGDWKLNVSINLGPLPRNRDSAEDPVDLLKHVSL
jgi:hypothetical protein